MLKTVSYPIQLRKIQICDGKTEEVVLYKGKENSVSAMLDPGALFD